MYIVYTGRGKTCVYKTLINLYVRPWASRSSPIARGGRQRKTTSTFCTSHVYDDASAMTVSSRTCLRAENSSSLRSWTGYQFLCESLSKLVCLLLKPWHTRGPRTCVIYLFHIIPHVNSGRLTNIY